DFPQFCGCTIAGLSLLSPSVLRLRSLREPREQLELLLEPRSLYVLRCIWGSLRGLGGPSG
ncbi:ALKB7 dioxygenase, partial [Nesospiza acunhae]|nr:ALKB7 dioxygenase [Nesospiza acunhae]